LDNESNAWSRKGATWSSETARRMRRSNCGRAWWWRVVTSKGLMSITRS
jgi:hypothetical protein